MMRRSGGLAIAAVVLAGCGDTGPGQFDVGVKRVALALAFAEEELAEPVAPQIIRQYVPAPAEIDLAAPPPFDEIDFDIPNPLACPTAPAGAAPREAVRRAVVAPPAPGAYPRHNEGKIDVTGGLVPLSLPFPPLTAWMFGERTAVPRTPGPFAGSPFDTTPPGDDYELDLRKVLVEGVFVVTDRLRFSHDRIELVTRMTEASGATTVFTPDPPITLYQYGVEGDEWSSAGIDTATNTAMLVEGTIEAREVVDVCGEVVDTYRVAVDETTVNLQTGETSGTDLGRPNVYNVSPNHGGLVVREDVRSTTHARDPESGAPVTVVFEYVSTVNVVEPASL